MKKKKKKILTRKAKLRKAESIAKGEAKEERQETYMAKKAKKEFIKQKWNSIY
jgi:hypothetical protein